MSASAASRMCAAIFLALLITFSQALTIAGLHHLRRDILEAHARFMDGHPVQFAEFIEHRRGRERFDDVAAFAAHIEKIERQQRVYAQLIDA